MDEAQEGILLIGTTTALFIIFSIAVFSVMLIYRRRKLEHVREIQEIDEKYKQELLQAQLQAQRHTMQQIGREIHDNVGQQLTLAFLFLQDSSGQIKDNMSKSADVIDQALKDLRSLSSSLINQEVLNHNLTDLLSRETAKLKSLQACKVYASLKPIDLITAPETNHFVLRIFQEFTQNSLKYAQCESLDISLSQNGSELLLSVEDDGIGFNVEKEWGNGMGLLNMKKRAEAIGAYIAIRSHPGIGTSLKLNIPSNLNTP